LNKDNAAIFLQEYVKVENVFAKLQENEPFHHYKPERQSLVHTILKALLSNINLGENPTIMYTGEDHTGIRIKNS